MAPILALRELGWVKGYEIIVNPEENKRFQRTAALVLNRAAIRARITNNRNLLRGKIVFVNSWGMAWPEIAKLRDYHRGVVARDKAGSKRGQQHWMLPRFADTTSPPPQRYTRKRTYHPEYLLQAPSGHGDKRHISRKRRDLLTALEELGWIRNSEIVAPPTIEEKQ